MVECRKGRRKRTVSICRYEIMKYLENPKKSVEKLLHRKRKFNEVVGNEFNIQKAKDFIYTNNDQLCDIMKGKTHLQ